LGAICIRHFKKEKELFESLKGVVVFITFGVFLPPVVKAVLNGLISLETGRGSDYWTFWTVFSTNVVSNLILVPAIVICWRNGMSWFQHARFAQYIELGALAVATVSISVLVFSGGKVTDNTPVVICALLPLSFWAAMRFGAGGLSASLLGIALIAIWNTIDAQVPLGTLATVQDILAHRVLSLHGLLMAFGFPFIVMAGLIAELHHNKESIQNTRRNLIRMQEQERHRIAQELHTDIAGRLTLLGLNVDKLRIESSASARPALDQLYVEISDAFQETLDLSHEVHSFMVEYLGLATALKKLCRDAGKQSDVTFDFSVESVPLPLSSVVSHRLFRVAKEALRNVAQHSCAKTATVKLTLRGERIVLWIADDGIGMGPQCNEALGITYMREQVLSLGGTFKLLSAPSKGTVIEATVPIDVSP